MLETITQLGIGGAGMQGQDPGSAAAAIKELQGLSIELLAGAAANTKINVAAIRKEDTIIKALNNSAGTITDITANVTIDALNAVGTITLAGVTAGQTVVVAGVTYTAVAGTPTAFNQFTISGTDTEDATSLAAAINATETNRDAQQVTATSAAGVVTVKALAEGTSGNSIAMTKNGAGITLSGAVLAGGTATGGIRSTSVTNQVILFWFNKK